MSDTTVNPSAEEIAELQLNVDTQSNEPPVEESQPEQTPTVSVKSNPILDRISSVRESTPYLKALIYGEPGVGKTVFAAGAPNPLFIDVENGTLSLLNHPEYANTQKFKFTEYKDIEDLFWELKKGALPEIETIVIDSISELQRRQMDYILKREYQRNPQQRNPYLPHQGDYKENTEVLRRLIVQLQELERHLVVIAHSLEVKNEITGQVSLRPAVTPKLSGSLEDLMDFIGYYDTHTEDKEGKKVTTRLLQTVKTPRVLAKCRIGNLDDVMINPHFNQLINAKLSNEQEG